MGPCKRLYQTFDLTAENNVSRISCLNPVPNNIIVKLNMVNLGEAWKGLCCDLEGSISYIVPVGIS